MRFTLVNANHSSSSRRRRLPRRAGRHGRRDDGTADALLRGRHERLRRHGADPRIYAPDVAVLPIGEHFTMGPSEAAVALELLGVAALRPVPLRHVRAAHRHARELRELVPSGIEMIARAPGETIEL